ncbi:hypothetical protein TSOC_009007 [Tetrabaena socialis]|uniref:EGF domain-specific O-linked N-acetylglucosamine transferase n=1 Tax=Tetrabaena socialis TaxID=47790 RepID=A0A2J7ZX55_9CHLO|nr:hypothetical protein TSOC_009007 [Tetrabaena socialis]|eukprot:PNH04842.1 hypothetical protein TSOC_009007 [Tetrabaena socialis]
MKEPTQQQHRPGQGQQGQPPSQVQQAPPTPQGQPLSAVEGAQRASSSGNAAAATRTKPPPVDHTLSLPNWCSVGAYAAEGAQLYTRMTRSAPGYKVYHNAFWHAHKWYALVPPEQLLGPNDHSASEGLVPSNISDSAGPGGTTTTADNGPQPDDLEEGISVNCALIRLPIANISGFTDGLRSGFMPGTTLLVDFPFPAFPDHLGHWAEVMLPTFSVLLNGHWREDAIGTRGRFVDRIVLPNLRKEVNDWFKEVLALAVSPGVRRGGAPVPPIIDHADLDGFPKLSWLAFENLLVVRDRYTHPDRKTGFIGADHGDLWRYDGCARYVDKTWDVGFDDPQHASAFRAAAYKRTALPQPLPWTPGSAPLPTLPGTPHILTFIMPHEDYPPLLNWQEVQTVLRRVASAHGLAARTVTLSTDAPFASHLDTFARSSVVVGRHGPLLATAALMAPGSAIFELLPYKWEWLGISRLYFNITQSAGDLHHFAWRPTDYRLAHYDHENYTRYRTWTPEECSARECLMELEALLSAKLPGIMAGQPVEELRAPWPKAV